MSRRLMKAAVFTDIHFGRRNSSETHNQDCLDFVEWFCEQATTHKADHIIFMGDWYENRSSINIHTMNYAYAAATKLNALNIPVFMIVGNHDCYRKHSRDIHSLVSYKEFSNITVIEDIMVVPEIGNTGALMCPYIFHHEYDLLKGDVAKQALETWWGHFEFQGFVITGNNVKMPSGPDPVDFSGPRKIFSGHFHKRQSVGNVTYIGNTFPMDFSDSGDENRGCLIFDHHNLTETFINWEHCPKFQKVLLSDLVSQDPDNLIKRGAKVKCYVDTQLTFEESVQLKEALVEQYSLREFSWEELISLNELARDSEYTDEDVQVEDVDHLVIRLLGTLNTDKIKAEKLVSIYNSLQVTL